MSEAHTVNLTKQTLPQLQDLLERQQSLMKNKKLLQRLTDNGQSVIHLHDKIVDEIKHRKEINSIEQTLSSLTINSNNAEFLKEKHVKYVCSKEKPIEDRYRPHRTLIHPKELTSSSDKSPSKREVTAASEPKLIHEPTKTISLSESLVIESEQAHRVMEEKAKKALRSLANDLLETEDDENKEDANVENEAFMEES